MERGLGMMSKRISVILICGIVLAGMCSAAFAEQAKKETYILDLAAGENPFWVDARQTYEAIKDVYPVKAQIGGTLGVDVSKQIANMDTYIAEEVDGIILVPIDGAALTDAVNRAVDAGIPVVTWLNDCPKSKRLTFVTSPFEASTEVGGEYIAKLIDYEGKCAISMALVGMEEQEGRAQGYKNIINKYPGMELVGIVEDKYDERTGANQLKPLLTKHPDVKAIFGCNARSGKGAVMALQEMNYKPGDIKIAAFDYAQDTLDAMGKRWIQCSHAQRSSYMTLLCFQLLYSYKHKVLYPPKGKWEEFGVPSAPKKIVVPITLITQDNYKAFYRYK